MDGRRSNARVLGRLARHAALALAVVAAATVVTPGVAAAAGGDVLPVLNCVTPDGRGGYTAWLGYRNTGTSTESIDLGYRNRISPSRYDGDQPTRFRSGTQSRVFSLTVSSGSVAWTLDDTTLWISASSSPSCSGQTATPEPAGQVTPLVDCIERESSWTYTAVIGYSSTYKNTVTLPLGSDNSVLLSQDDPPTVFSPGVHHGVASLSITALGAFWTLDGTSLYIAPGRAPECPAETTMPAEGNDTAAAFALVGAAAVGALLIRRARRQLSGGKTTSDPEDGNA
ncbi:hypothetical protein [Geodermatophilus sp. URMC 64]